MIPGSFELIRQHAINRKNADSALCSATKAQSEVPDIRNSNQRSASTEPRVTSTTTVLVAADIFGTVHNVKIDLPSNRMKMSDMIHAVEQQFTITLQAIEQLRKKSKLLSISHPSAQRDESRSKDSTFSIIAQNNDIIPPSQCSLQATSLDLLTKFQRAELCRFVQGLESELETASSPAVQKMFLVRYFLIYEKNPAGSNTCDDSSRAWFPLESIAKVQHGTQLFAIPINDSYMTLTTLRPSLTPVRECTFGITRKAEQHCERRERIIQCVNAYFSSRSEESNLGEGCTKFNLMSIARSASKFFLSNAGVPSTEGDVVRHECRLLADVFTETNGIMRCVKEAGQEKDASTMFLSSAAKASSLLSLPSPVLERSRQLQHTMMSSRSLLSYRALLEKRELQAQRQEQKSDQCNGSQSMSPLRSADFFSPVGTCAKLFTAKREVLEKDTVMSADHIPTPEIISNASDTKVKGVRNNSIEII